MKALVLGVALLIFIGMVGCTKDASENQAGPIVNNSGSTSENQSILGDNAIKAANFENLLIGSIENCHAVTVCEYLGSSGGDGEFVYLKFKKIRDLKGVQSNDEFDIRMANTGVKVGFEKGKKYALIYLLYNDMFTGDYYSHNGMEIEIDNDNKEIKSIHIIGGEKLDLQLKTLDDLAAYISQYTKLEETGAAIGFDYVRTNNISAIIEASQVIVTAKVQGVQKAHSGRDFAMVSITSSLKGKALDSGINIIVPRDTVVEGEEYLFMIGLWPENTAHILLTSKENSIISLSDKEKVEEVKLKIEQVG